MLPTGESSEITLRRVEVMLWELLHSGTTVAEVDTILSDLLMRHRGSSPPRKEARPTSLH
jgi:hypothetical protein